MGKGDGERDEGIYRERRKGTCLQSGATLRAKFDDAIVIVAIVSGNFYRAQGGLLTRILKKC